VSIFGRIWSAFKIIPMILKLNLYKELAASKKENIELAEQLSRAKKEIEELKNLIAKTGSLVFSNNAYYLFSFDGKPSDGPFCSSCWDNNKKLIHLHISNSPTGTKAMWCPFCKTYGGPK
jgi:hypothetical protein